MADEPLKREDLINVMGNLRIMLPAIENAPDTLSIGGEDYSGCMGNIFVLEKIMAAEAPDPPEDAARRKG